jgi:hypothetical protein
VHILVQTVTVVRRLDQVADRTGKPARSLPDGKQMKRIGTSGPGSHRGSSHQIGKAAMPITAL